MPFAPAPPLGFDWDAAKYLRNLSKHGVPFDEAIFAFEDPGGLEVQGALVDGGSFAKRGLAWLLVGFYISSTQSETTVL